MTNTFLEIDKSQVAENIKLASKGKQVCLMVKANNYGVGYDFIPEFTEMGYNYFGVTTIEEADIVRALAPDSEILIVGYVDEKDYAKAVLKNYTLTIFSEETLQTLNSEIKYHLKFDTGMGRIGFFKDQIANLKNQIAEIGNYPVGIYTHLPEGLNQEFSLNQIELFKEILTEFADYDFEYVHMQNSVGCQLYDLDFCNMVRPGISIWGLYADEEEKKIIEQKNGVTIKPALNLQAKVHMVKDYEGLIGYDLSEYVSGKIATIRIGYHDGFNRRFTGYTFNTSERVVGKVCMCQAFVQINGPIDHLEIFGPTNSIYNLTTYAKMTTYELLVSMSNRILRRVV